MRVTVSEVRILSLPPFPKNTNMFVCFGNEWKRAGKFLGISLVFFGSKNTGFSWMRAIALTRWAHNEFLGYDEEVRHAGVAVG